MIKQAAYFEDTIIWPTIFEVGLKVHTCRQKLTSFRSLIAPGTERILCEKVTMPSVRISEDTQFHLLNKKFCSKIPPTTQCPEIAQDRASAFVNFGDPFACHLFATHHTNRARQPYASFHTVPEPSSVCEVKSTLL